MILETGAHMGMFSEYHAHMGMFSEGWGVVARAL